VLGSYWPTSGRNVSQKNADYFYVARENIAQGQRSIFDGCGKQPFAYRTYPFHASYPMAVNLSWQYFEIIPEHFLYFSY
jgi:hypothetical protein